MMGGPRLPSLAGGQVRLHLVVLVEFALDVVVDPGKFLRQPCELTDPTG